MPTSLSPRSASIVILALLSVCLGSSPAARSDTVEYDLHIDYHTVNFTGRDVQAMTINGQIPGPTLEFSEGDTVRVNVHNRMDVDTSIHWHGILLPNDQDGVPYITNWPIAPGETYTYEFSLRHTGTFWYHSHTRLQEQRGVYGAFVIHPRQERVSADRDYVVVVSDWTDENPMQVLRNLKKDGDYYALKKDAVQSWWKVLQYRAIGRRLRQSWSRMGPMDLSDVGYDRFLINGKPVTTIGEAMSGERIRLRIINASASTYHYIEFAGGKMQVVSADGTDVEPVEVDRLLMGVAETYDVIVTLPQSGAYELRATSQDGTGYASGFLGSGPHIRARDIPKPNLLLMDHSMHGGTMDHSMHGGGEMDHSMHGGTMDHSMSGGEMDHSMHGGMMDHSMHGGGRDHAAMGHGSRIVQLDYGMLKAVESTQLPPENPERVVELELTGNMERYVWSFNGRTLSEADKILIRRGENVRFVFINKTMMHHPLHLHGHFFRVLNGQGAYSPLKHTVDVAPMARVEIEFLGQEHKDWFFHCHNLYHMKTGMSRIIHYEGDAENPAFERTRRRWWGGLNDTWYGVGQGSAQSHMVETAFAVSNVRNAFEIEHDNDYDGSYDTEVSYRRYLSRFVSVFAGGEFERDDDAGQEDAVAIWGIRYVLPLIIDSTYRMDHHGGFQVGMDQHLQLTDRLQLNIDYELKINPGNAWDYDELEIEHDYRIELEYRATKNFSIVGTYDADYRGGGGIRWRF